MSTPYLGEIRAVGFTFAPVGWVACNGQTLPISQYDALYTLLGTTYGATGRPPLTCPICAAG
ncbi:phage tail protein [Hymenobacter sp. BRD67]|uniref:phage tail protein n=1 Tax=Hymenobacter sp. BRD67 TaxID=2675877 RepID=UPI001C25EEF6|nr:tail fiber protein [Hymenobacter sp. BRD67]